MKQTIWLYTLCYNEQHFVKNFLAAYKDVDRIVVYDNMSTDNTVSLLKEDPRVEIRTYDSGGTIRDDMYLDIKNNSWKEARGKADWVIVVDFDEIFSRVRFNGREPIFDLNLEVPYNEGFNIIKPYGYNMVSLDAPLGAEGHPYLYSKKGAYHVPQEKMVCFRPDQVKEIGFHAGCHRADPLGMDGTTKNIQIRITEDFKILHYKFWNRDLYMEKTRDYRNRNSEVNKQFGWAWHYMEDDEYHYNLITRGAEHVVDLADIKTPR